MKKIITILFCLFFTASLFAQEETDIIVYGANKHLNFYSVKLKTKFENLIPVGPTPNDIYQYNNHIFVVNSGKFGVGTNLQIVPVKALYKFMQTLDTTSLRQAARTVELAENGNAYNIAGITDTEVLVSLAQTKQLQVVDFTTGEIVKTISEGITGNPQGVAKANDDYAVVTMADWGTTGGKTYAYYNIKTGVIEKENTTHLNPVSILKLDNGNLLGATWGAWFGDDNFGTLDLIDSETQTIDTSIALPNSGKASFALQVDDSLVYVMAMDASYQTVYGHLNIDKKTYTEDTLGFFTQPIFGKTINGNLLVKGDEKTYVYTTAQELVDSMEFEISSENAVVKFPEEFATEDPTIVEIKDIPNDQGGNVLVVWEPSSHDELYSGAPITKYSVWRREVSEAPAQKIAPKAGKLYNAIKNSWTYLGSVEAVAQIDKYSFVAPTLADSNASGNATNVFMVVAHTSDASKYFYSVPASGYSVDNIAPAAPAKVLANIDEGKFNITWSKNKAADFAAYNIYKSTTQGFLPKAGDNLLATVNDTIFTDKNVSGDVNYYYIISAVDRNGNESLYSKEISIIFTGVEEGNSIPEEFALAQNYPNPFNPSTKIAFNIPAQSNVAIVVYNMIGQKVAELYNGSINAGHHELTWNAEDFASGIYILSMKAKATDSAEAFNSTRKLMLVK